MGIEIATSKPYSVAKPNLLVQRSKSPTIQEGDVTGLQNHVSGQRDMRYVGVDGRIILKRKNGEM